MVEASLAPPPWMGPGEEKNEPPQALGNPVLEDYAKLADDGVPRRAGGAERVLCSSQGASAFRVLLRSRVLYTGELPAWSRGWAGLTAVATHTGPGKYMEKKHRRVTECFNRVPGSSLGIACLPSPLL